MNTLNYKVLLIKTGLIVFVRAVGIYLLMTIPALVANMYLYLVSASYAISFGWIAAAIFLLLFWMLYKMKAGIRTKKIILYASVAMAVLVAFQMMQLLGAEDHIWQSGIFLLFPLVAIVSGWLSLAVSKRAVKNLFVPEAVNLYESMMENTGTMADQYSIQFNEAIQKINK